MGPILISTIYLLLSLVVVLIAWWELRLFIVGGAAFVNTPKHAYQEIGQLLDVRPGDVVYDLGCGNAQVLLYLSKMYPEAEYIGIENTTIGYLISRLNHARSGGAENLKILKKDFMKHPVSNASHIFVWLSPEMMEVIYPKMKEELKPGTRLLSSGFPFTAMKPTIEKYFESAKGPFGKRFYLYEF